MNIYQVLIMCGILCLVAAAVVAIGVALIGVWDDDDDGEEHNDRYLE